MPWEAIQDPIGLLDEDDQARYLGELLEAPAAVPVVPAVNQLIGLRSSEARGRALAAALPQLSDEDAHRLAFGVSWDLIEFSWVVQSFPDSVRPDAVRMVLERVLRETPSSPAQAEVLARIAPLLDDSDRARAIAFMEASAAATPPVPPHEEVGRQVAEMLTVRTPETGRALGFEMSAGPSRPMRSR